MLGQSHPKKKVATFSSTSAGFTLAAQTDPLAFTDAAGNLDLILFHLLRTGSPQRYGPRRAVQRFFECDHNVRFHIRATFGCRRASAEPAECGTTSPAAKKRFEEIAEPSSAELELNPAAAIAAPLIKPAAGLLALPLRRRLETAGPVPIRTELIVFLPLFRIAQNFVRLVDLLEFFFGGLFVLRDIRVVLTRQLSKGAANLVLGRRFRHPECLVIISKLYRHLRNVVRLRSSRTSLSHAGYEGHQGR